jgi:virginiamycin B lyase
MKQLCFSILMSVSFVAFDPPTSSAQDAPPFQSSYDELDVREIPKGGGSVGFGFNAFWVASAGRLTRIGSDGHDMAETILASSGGPCRGVAVGEGAVWVPDCGRGLIYKVDPASMRVTLEIDTDMFTSEGSIGVGHGAVWVVTADPGERTLTRYSAATGETLAEILLPGAGTGVIVDFGSVWVTAAGKGELYQIDPQMNAIVSTAKLGGLPRSFTSGEGSIWVLNEASGAVQRIDGRTGLLLSTIAVGKPGTGDIVAGGGFVWVTMIGTVLSQIDPQSNTLVRTFTTEGRGGMKCQGIKYGGGSIWLAGFRLQRVQAPEAGTSRTKSPSAISP